MKTGSKTSFYKWIDDIKKAYRHRAELEEKLQFYETRLIGYNAVTYDSIGSSSTKNNVEENLLYVIGKIDDVKEKIDKAQKLIDEYISFKEDLNYYEIEILDYEIRYSYKKNEILLILKISKSRFYQLYNQIIKKFDLSIYKIE